MMAVSILIFHFPHFDNIHFNTPRLEGLDKNTFDGISDPVLMMDLPLKNIFSIIYVHGDCGKNFLDDIWRHLLHFLSGCYPKSKTFIL
jgi:hypothetical protein